MDYDKAYALARSIRDSEEYQTLKNLSTKIEQDPNANRMLSDFRKRQLELEMKQLTGEEVDSNELETMKRLYDTITLHQDIKRFFEAEQRIQLIYQDIQKIIMEPLQDLYNRMNEKGGS